MQSKLQDAIYREEKQLDPTWSLAGANAGDVPPCDLYVEADDV